MSRANEPCFPTLGTPSGDMRITIGGLTIREEFAKAAMQGILANECSASLVPRMGGNPTDEIAAVSVKMADALLAALAKEQPK